MTEKAAISPEVLAKIKEQLLADKARMEAELASVATGDSNNEMHAKFPEYGDKIDENAQEIESYTTNLATEKILEDNLRDIESALERIENGTYGICKYCGKPIAEKRLEIRPVASACVECKQKLQNG
jgi:RNA polymerase-binding protein DksA